MADIIKSPDSAIQDPPTLWKDMGGYHAPVVAFVPVDGESAAESIYLAAEELTDGLLVHNGACSISSLNLATTSVGGWFLLLDISSDPGSSSVDPKRVWRLEANQSVDIGFDSPINLLAGCFIAFSTAATPFTRTAGSDTAFIAAEVVQAAAL